MANYLDPGFSLGDDDQPVAVHVGDVLTKNNGTEWKIIGKDASGQGFVLRGPEGRIRCEPEGPGQTLRYPAPWRL